ncbi:flagellar filament capping protein FliD [Clostridium beijerinckii]|uniref:flagellar filament capping protein FliD n=1 Tax=Clostridium beijerinckii TaxID=1520 RepID=UPI0022E696ED|nr:flagellar filament capping protein FliD [Clostridium beijerinckii]
MTSIMQSSSTNSSSTSSKNLLRISGMASGIDTDSVVKSMVSNYQAKIDKANQAKQILQWKQDAYRDIIKGVKGLQEYFNPTSDKYILGSNSMNINTATSDITSIASATATSSATAGTYSVDVTKLAEQAEIQGNAKDSLIKISDFKAHTTQQISGTSGTVDLSGLNSNGATLVADINNKISESTSSLKGQLSASYVKETINGVTTEYIKFTNTSSDTSLKYTDSAYTGTSSISINSGISSSTKLSDLGIKASNGEINFKVNGKAISLTPVDGTTTVQNLMDAVKSATSGAVTMNIDDITGSISFQSKDYGSTSSVTLEDTGSTLTNLGITLTSGKASDTGADAIVEITAPGQATTTTTQSSNQFTINGMNYNLVNKGTTNITVTADSDKVVTNIKDFIKDYNTIISTINTKLTEKKNNDYPPLTDAQKESMSEDQIKAWETKAQVGILRNDEYLSNLMSQLRGVFSSPVYSSYTSGDPTKNSKVALSFGKYGNAVGIDTSKDVTDGGLLVVADENKLTNAIKNNLEDFKKLFIGATDNPELSDDKSYIGSDNYMEDGLLKRMDNILRQYVAAPGLGQDGKYTLSGSMNIFVNKQYDYSSSGYSSKNTLSDQVYKQTLVISKLNTQMSDAENRYYKQFSALESAMNSLNSQQSALTSMFSAG